MNIMRKNITKNKKILKRLGGNVKFYRQKLNLTQEDIAEKLDAERSYITAIECGTKSPSIYFLYELAQALNITLKELMDITIG